MHSKLRIPGAPDSPQAQSRASVTSLCRLQGFALPVNPYHSWIVTSDALADSLLSFLHLFRVLPNTSRPRHASRVPLLRFVRPFLKQPTPDKSEIDLRKVGVRFSGYARKRWIPLRGAKIPS
jgi:hypothetical protein